MMKRLTILGIIICMAVLVGPAAVNGQPPGPPGPPTSNVNVVNTPLPVDVANAPDVYIVNQDSESVPVNVTSGCVPEREPWQIGNEISLGEYTGFRGTYYIVPADKRLTINYYSVWASVQADADGLEFGLWIGIGSPIDWLAYFNFPMFHRSSSQYYDFWFGGGHVLVHAGPGEKVSIGGAVYNSASTTFRWGMSGYLEPLP